MDSSIAALKGKNQKADSQGKGLIANQALESSQKFHFARAK